MPHTPLIKTMFSLGNGFYKRITRLLLPAVFALSIGNNAKAQEMNLGAYDHTRLHFGFIIAFNTTNFVVQPIENLGGHFNDTLKMISSKPLTSFNLGIVSELKIGPYLKLRFVPDLAFSDRDLEYFFASSKDTIVRGKPIESTFLDFPIDIKLISKRLVNFQAYVLAGAKYVTDLASQANVDQALAGANATVRLVRNDYQYEAGAGVQFFLPYFKFGLEIKLSQGIRNLVVRDNTVYTQSLESLTSKVWLFTLTFEG